MRHKLFACAERDWSQTCGSRLFLIGPRHPRQPNAHDTPALSVACLQRQAILSTGTAITSRQLLRVVSKIVMRPDEESWSGRPTDFKWPSLRIGSGNGSSWDAKGIIVGVHDRQS